MKPIMASFFAMLALVGTLASCTQEQGDVYIFQPEKPVQTDSIRYLALGDSYTIGESVAEIDRYPMQLSGRLRAEGLPVTWPRIVARTGWSTGDLLSALAANPPVQPIDMVTLLIGVNNQYRGLSLSSYEDQFRQLLQMAVQYAGKNRVFVLSIPDYAYTPFGSRSADPARISREIDAFNAANRRITEEAGVRYVDITPISRRGLEEPLLVATDGLHPSGEMYRRWVEGCWKEIAVSLRK